MAEAELHELSQFAPSANVVCQPLSSVSIVETPPHILPVSRSTSVSLLPPILPVTPLHTAPIIDELSSLVSAFDDLAISEVPRIFSQPVARIGGRRRSRKGFTDKALAVLRRIRDEALGLGDQLNDVSHDNWTLEAVVRIENRLDAMDIAIYKIRRSESEIDALRSKVDETIFFLRKRCEDLRSDLPAVQDTLPVDFCSGVYLLSSHVQNRVPNNHTKMRTSARELLVSTLLPKSPY